MTPTVFISYSHDNDEHKEWVFKLAKRLRSNGVDVSLDRWNLTLGSDLTAFMERVISKSDRIICICSEAYVNKTNEISGGAGYEKRIMTAKLLKNLNADWVIPLIKNNSSNEKVPIFLSSEYYISFEDESSYELKYQELLRDLLNEPAIPIPPIGPNPFKNIKDFSEQIFIADTEKYVSPSFNGRVTFDYSNNNGRYFIGQGKLMFELRFSKASDQCIHLYKDSDSVISVALANDKDNTNGIEDARAYDSSSRARSPKINQIAIVQNRNGFYAAIKIVSIKDDSRGADFDEVVFDYIIQTNGSPDFTNLDINK